MIHKTKYFSRKTRSRKRYILILIRTVVHFAVMMTLTLLKCCNMLESSEQSIVSPLLGLKSQDLHQLCIAIVPQDFTRPSPLVN